jgi:hypothetical protein
MGTFTPVDFVKMRDYFVANGVTVQSAGAEAVFVRQHSTLRGVQLKVYASCSADSGACRTKGADAIRVVAVYWDRYGKSQALTKATRVFRTGGSEAIVTRTWRACQQIAEKVNTTFSGSGGGLRYADSGRLVSLRERTNDADAIQPLQGRYQSPAVTSAPELVTSRFQIHGLQAQAAQAVREIHDDNEVDDAVLARMQERAWKDAQGHFDGE